MRRNGIVQQAPKRSSREQFDRQASEYDAKWSTWSEETLRWLIDAADLRPTDIALDVATGGGFTALELAARVASVVATDVSSNMLALASERALQGGLRNIRFVEAPAESLPLASASFDVVACRIAAHHFVDVKGFISESFRVLRPGGRFVVVDTSVPDRLKVAARWQNDVEVLRDPSHFRNYSPAEWQGFIADAGFIDIDVRDTFGGITIPLESWIAKAGCSPDQADEVRRMFAKAPETARKQFDIRKDANGETLFTWRRVLIKAEKPRD